MASALLENSGAITTNTPTTISTEAQDIAKATGVAYSDLSTPSEEGTQSSDYADYNSGAVKDTISNTVDFQEPSSYLDKATGTVMGQLNTILDSESPYIQQARTQAAEQSQSRGLLNTTMAAQAGQEAAIKQALPIAQQDAQTYSNMAQARQAADYNVETIQAEAITSGEIVKQQAAISQTQQNINNAFTAAKQAADTQSQAWLGDLENTYNVQMQELTNLQNQALQEADISANRAESIRTQSSEIMQNYQVSVENMMTDPDFLELGSEAVNNAINQMQQLAKNSILFLGSSSGVDMTDYVDAYLTDLTVLEGE